jgi:hypothetical protein
MFHQQWDTGYMIGMIVTIVLTVVFGIIAIVAGVRWLRQDSEQRDNGYSGLVAVVAAVIFLIAGAVGTWVSFPWSGQYHRYQPQAGVVAKVGSRFLASDQTNGGTTQKFVVTFKDGRSFGCLDTRCSNVAVGDDLTLMCERAFQFNAPYPGWDCNWGIDRKPDGTVIP